MRPCPPVSPPAGYCSCASLLVYEDGARDLITHIKYRNERSAIPWLATRMAELVDRSEVDVVTWAPTTERRRRERGFDQSELLARRVARSLERPVRNLLHRRSGAPQTGGDAGERSHRPEYRARRRLDGATVLVVDDVLTTGATLRAAGRALREADAGRLAAVVAAHPL